MEPVVVMVLDGEEWPISICLTQHRLSHQLGSSCLLQEDPVVGPLMLVMGHAILAMLLNQGIQILSDL